ncbi:MAG: 50S ribosomal protein L6 [Thermoplasmata archaeon]|nr:50S ribosomal protein L6 [Thermoplasmata archaeon]
MSSESSAAVVPGEVQIALPEGVHARLENETLTVQGPHGEIHRAFPVGALRFNVQGPTVTLTLLVGSERKKARSLLNTWERHIANMAQGVVSGFEARMKVVAAHFPMKVAVKEHSLVIENFLGEKYPRTASILPGVEAKVDGEFVILTGTDIERVGQSAANIERTTKIRDYDPRVFQDGIYIVERARPRATEGA